MPFDGQNFQTVSFAEADGRTRLRMLADALRRQLPVGFAWDYSTTGKETDCGTAGCAIGLARWLWQTGTRGGVFMHRHLGITIDEAEDLFNEPATYGQRRFGDVTPHMVADAIDRYLETGRVEYMPAGAGDGQRSPTTAEERAHEKRSSGNIDGRPGRSGVPAHAEGVAG